jgi:hypothetical protein
MNSCVRGLLPDYRRKNGDYFTLLEKGVAAGRRSPLSYMSMYRSYEYKKLYQAICHSEIKMLVNCCKKEIVYLTCIIYSIIIVMSICS